MFVLLGLPLQAFSRKDREVARKVKKHKGDKTDDYEDSAADLHLPPDGERDFSSRSSGGQAPSPHDLKTRLENMKDDVAGRVKGGGKSSKSNVGPIVQSGGLGGAGGVSSGSASQLPDAGSSEPAACVKLEVASSLSSRSVSSSPEKPFAPRSKDRKRSRSKTPPPPL